MSRIHALQSSTTSQKLLESVRSLRPLLCEALRASGCDTTCITEHDPILLQHVDQNEDVWASQSSCPTQRQCLEVLRAQEELAIPHAISAPGTHIHEFDVNANHGHDCHKPEKYLPVQDCSSRHGARKAQNFADDGVEIQFLVDVEHHVYGQYQEGNTSCFNTEYRDAPSLGHDDAHYCDTRMYDAHRHRWDGHQNEHGHDRSVNTYMPLSADYRSDILRTQKDRDQIVQIIHSSPTTVEPSINIDPYNPLLCNWYSEAVDQHIRAYHQYSVQHHFPSKTRALLNTMLLEAPGSKTDDIIIGAGATSDISNKLHIGHQG